jgi:hypothetical protein
MGDGTTEEGSQLGKVECNPVIILFEYAPPMFFYLLVFVMDFLLRNASEFIHEKIYEMYRASFRCPRTTPSLIARIFIR